MSLIANGASIALALVFVASVRGKVGNVSALAKTIEGYGIPPGFARVSSPLTVIAETSVAALLLIPATRPVGLWGAASLLAVFTALVSWALFNGRAVSCGCFSLQDELDAIGPATVVRNVLLIGIAFGGLVAPANPPVGASIPWSMGTAALLLALTIAVEKSVRSITASAALVQDLQGAKPNSPPSKSVPVR